MAPRFCASRRRIAPAVTMLALSLAAASAFGFAGGSAFLGRSFTGPRQKANQAPVQAQKQVEEGHRLFVRDWRTHRVERGDGLGPMFNAVSCAECHESGAPGGAADRKHNVDLLTLLASPKSTSLSSFESRAKDVHPGFTKFRLSVILHTHGTDSQGTTNAYRKWRQQILRTGYENELSLKTPVGKIQGMKVRLSQRNTPALFGAGLIDSIPDHVLVAIADEEKADHPEIRGRVPRDGAGRVGRFGWRGQVDHLHEFVLAACANELGLSVPGHAQPGRVHIVARDDDSLKGVYTAAKSEPLDATAKECLALSTFVGALMPPARAGSASVTHARDISAGERIFSEIGCSHCHRPSIESVHGIYSDLLLHDMGGELSDPISANPDSGGAFGSSAYYGTTAPPPPQIANGSNAGQNPQQEWRTPPLWGVGDSAPYLHDGRAETLNDAILLHAGQGRRSAREYAALSKPDRERVLNFLASLAAPRIDGTAPSPVVLTLPVGEDTKRTFGSAIPFVR